MCAVIQISTSIPHSIDTIVWNGSSVSSTIVDDVPGMNINVKPAVKSIITLSNRMLFDCNSFKLIVDHIFDRRIYRNQLNGFHTYTIKLADRAHY